VPLRPWPLLKGGKRGKVAGENLKKQHELCRSAAPDLLTWRTDLWGPWLRGCVNELRKRDLKRSELGESVFKTNKPGTWGGTKRGYFRNT